MTELEQAILDAWQRIAPRLAADPAELARRLARRRMSTLLRPPRAWCLAVRASDTRIHKATAAMVPEHAMDVRGARHVTDPNAPTQYRKHEVTLDAPLMRLLCRPVYIRFGGEDWKDVARRLGVHEETLRYRMRHGAFEVKRWPCAGRRGKPVPELYAGRTLDPSLSNLNQAADPIWGITWQFLADHVPNIFEQSVTRRPVYRRYGRQSSQQERFRGWRWICPGCRRAVRTLYYPMPPLDLPRMLGAKPPLVRSRRQRRDFNDVDRIEPPPPCFACVKCHRVRYFSRINRDSWNQMIAYLSAGLLYGHEVQKSESFKPLRQREYHPHLLRPASPRRQEVLDRLLKGWSYRAIAKDLGVGYGTVHAHVKLLYKQHRVHSRDQLAAALKAQLPSRITAPKREEVRRRLMLGESWIQIAREMRISWNAVHHHVREMRRERRPPGDRTAVKCYTARRGSHDRQAAGTGSLEETA